MIKNLCAVYLVDFVASFWATVCKTVRLSYWTLVCLSCPVCDVGQTVGRISSSGRDTHHLRTFSLNL